MFLGFQASSPCPWALSQETTICHGQWQDEQSGVVETAQELAHPCLMEQLQSECIKSSPCTWSLPHLEIQHHWFSILSQDSSQGQEGPSRALLLWKKPRLLAQSPQPGPDEPGLLMVLSASRVPSCRAKAPPRWAPSSPSPGATQERQQWAHMTISLLPLTWPWDFPAFAFHPLPRLPVPVSLQREDRSAQLQLTCQFSLGGVRRGEGDKEAVSVLCARL